MPVIKYILRAVRTDSYLPDAMIPNTEIATSRKKHDMNSLYSICVELVLSANMNI